MRDLLQHVPCIPSYLTWTLPLLSGLAAEIGVVRYSSSTVGEAIVHPVLEEAQYVECTATTCYRTAINKGFASVCHG